ncbi:MAG: hypothetical protein FJW27_18510 [Acidimicrobiia bacterium]|nr:hypothetical protein [Acidimicrobiia bacterium]
MDSAVRAAIRSLLDAERVLTAAVLVDKEPVAALLPYALSDDYGTFFVQASGLARHSRGLHADATVSVLVHASLTPEADPMQLPRLTVQTTVTALPRGETAFMAAAQRLIARFPIAATTLILPDFNVYALTLGRGRYVEGFARAFNVGPETFRTLAM